MLWTGSNLSISSGKRTREWALTFFARILLPRLLSRATRTWLLSTSLKWRACSQAVSVFIVVRDSCIVIIMAQSIPSIPITPRPFFKCWLLLWLSTAEQERTKLLKLSSVAKPVNSNYFCEIYLQLSEEIAPFLDKKKNSLLRNWKVPTCCFIMMKMLRAWYKQLDFLMIIFPIKTFHKQLKVLQDSLKNKIFPHSVKAVPGKMSKNR